MKLQFSNLFVSTNFFGNVFVDDIVRVEYVLFWRFWWNLSIPKNKFEIIIIEKFVLLNFFSVERIFFFNFSICWRKALKNMCGWILTLRFEYCCFYCAQSRFIEEFFDFLQKLEMVTVISKGIHEKSPKKFKFSLFILNLNWKDIKHLTPNVHFDMERNLFRKYLWQIPQQKLQKKPPKSISAFNSQLQNKPLSSPTERNS